MASKIVIILLQKKNKQNFMRTQWTSFSFYFGSLTLSLFLSPSGPLGRPTDVRARIFFSFKCKHTTKGKAATGVPLCCGRSDGESALVLLSWCPSVRLSVPLAASQQWAVTARRLHSFWERCTGRRDHKQRFYSFCWRASQLLVES